MISKKAAAIFSTIFLIVIACVVIAHVLQPNQPIHISGTVFDATTKKPFEGVFVLASYTKCGKGIVLGHVGSNCPCHQTMGIRTAKDGSFSFPSIDGSGLPTLSAIAPNYYVKEMQFPQMFDRDSDRERQKKLSGGEIWLTPQELGNPRYRYNTLGSYCRSIGAGKEFELAEIAERTKFWSKPVKE